MTRADFPFAVPLALALGMGCALLEAYPGGGDPAQALIDSSSTFDGGEGQEPLVDPATDSSISVTRNVTQVVAHPGSAFPIDIDFDAPGMNVVGGGIQFPGSNEVQWTFIQGLEGSTTGSIRFGFVVDESVCDEIPKLCHEIATKQFAVARNVTGDVDGDGQMDGEFVVSEAVEVSVILQCSTCESPSCAELLPEGDCSQCAQPLECRDYFEQCLDPINNPDVTDDDVQFFDVIFGTKGALWTTAAGCAAGKNACDEALGEVTPMGESECSLGGGS
jgi:hypothetical protein